MRLICEYLHKCTLLFRLSGTKKIHTEGLVLFPFHSNLCSVYIAVHVKFEKPQHHNFAENFK